MFLRHNIPAFIWTLVIFILCSMPGKAIPTFHWLELLSFDKFVHASIFFLLQLLYMRGFFLQENYPLLKKHYLVIPMTLCIAYGGSLELMQRYLFSQRSGDIGDFIANSFGVICAALLFKRLKRFIRLES